MPHRSLSELDADATRAALEDNAAAARAADARRLALAAHWADLHGVLDRPVGPALPGAERLIRLGGEGTPDVAEFAPAELGATIRLSPGAATALIADALDVRHRLPRLWARVQAGEVAAWSARRVAEAVRPYSAAAAGAADRRVTPFAHGKSAYQLEQIALAAAMGADPVAAQRQRREAEASMGVWVGRGTDDGVRDIFVRTDAASAVFFDAAVDRVADGLGLLGDTDTKVMRRGKAVGVLADPQEALDLYAAAAEADDRRVGGAGARRNLSDHPRRRVAGRQKAVLYVHLSQDAVAGGTGVARIEGVGPVVGDQVRSWLSRCDVTVKPVLDLAGVAPVDAYEIPDAMREAVIMRSPTDVFPYATGDARRADLDHTIAYRPPDRGGPPGQTRPGNLGPHGRFNHRLKTHCDGRWQVRQLADGVFVWRTPHGRHYLVDQSGTTKLDAVRRELAFA